MNSGSISQIARLLGISTTAIRKYEEKGLLKLRRNSDNDYREFSHNDVGTLIRMRQIRQAGFSLEDTSFMMNHARAEMIRDKIDKRQVELDNQIRECLLLKRVLDDWKDDIDDMNRGISWAVLPTYRYIKYLDSNNGVIKEPKKAQSYLAKMPISFPGIYFAESEALVSDKLDYDYSVGIFSPVDECDPFDPECGDIILPGGPCVSFSRCTSDYVHFGCEMLAQGRVEIKRRGFEISGDIVAKITLTMNHSNSANYRTWIRFNIPVRRLI